MDTTYIARHPIPMIGIAKGNTGLSVLFDRIATPVRLREVDPGEIHLRLRTSETLAFRSGGVGLSTYEMDGGFWHPFPCLLGRDSRSSFVDALEGRVEAGTDVVAAALLARSPLMACRRLGRVNLLPGLERGPGDVRATVLRDEARVTANLTRFLDERVVLAGDMAFVRSPGPVATHNLAQVYDYRILATTRALDSGVACDPSDIARHWDWYRSRTHASTSDRKRFATMEARLDRQVLRRRDEDLATIPAGDAWLTANETPDECIARTFTLSAALRKEFSPHLDAIQVDAMWGAVGELTGDEAIAAIARIASLAGEVAHRHPRSMLAELGERVSRVDLPRLAEAFPAKVMDEDDAAALSGMAP